MKNRGWVTSRDLAEVLVRADPKGEWKIVVETNEGPGFVAEGPYARPLREQDRLGLVWLEASMQDDREPIRADGGSVRESQRAAGAREPAMAG